MSDIVPQWEPIPLLQHIETTLTDADTGFLESMVDDDPVLHDLMLTTIQNAYQTKRFSVTRASKAVHRLKLYLKNRVTAVESYEEQIDKLEVECKFLEAHFDDFNFSCDDLLREDLEQTDELKKYEVLILELRDRISEYDFAISGLKFDCKTYVTETKKLRRETVSTWQHLDHLLGSETQNSLGQDLAKRQLKMEADHEDLQLQRIYITYRRLLAEQNTEVAQQMCSYNEGILQIVQAVADTTPVISAVNRGVQLGVKGREVRKVASSDWYQDRKRNRMRYAEEKAEYYEDVNEGS